MGGVREQSTKQFTIGGKVIGGPLPLICVPLVASNGFELAVQAEEIATLQPDLVEWRVDAYGGAASINEWLSALHQIRRIIGGIPLLFTYRSHREGGMDQSTDGQRQQVILDALATGVVDLVDVELDNEASFIDSVRQQAKEHDTLLILSHHVFDGMPEGEEIYQKVQQALAAGADIGKIAVTPQSHLDTLDLFRTTHRLRQDCSAPLITIAMGSKGVLSRLAGGFFGSDITFAMGPRSSAPGQVHITELRRAINLLFGEETSGA